MSGRRRVTLSDGRRVTGYRKTLRRVDHRTPVHEMPDFRLVMRLPQTLTFAMLNEGPTGVLGARIMAPLLLEVTGKHREWVLEQAAKFLREVAGDQDLKLTGNLTRGEADNRSVAHDFVIVAGPAVVVQRPYDDPIIIKKA